MSFLETTTELQLTNTTIRQLSRHTFEIVVDDDLAACRLSRIINQEFTLCSRPQNERVHLGDLGVPFHSAQSAHDPPSHDPFGARPLDTVDPGGELEYHALHTQLHALFE
jgi:hypothetical protein